MKALVLEAYNRLVFKDVDAPAAGPGEVLVRVKACGICGSDLHGVDGSTGRRRPPLIMGHEASGEISALGAGVTGWQVGERVTFDSTVYRMDDWYTRRGLLNLGDDRQVLGVSCEDYRRHGAFAELVSVPAHILYRIPTGVSFEQAAMIEPLSVAVHAAGRAPLAVGDTAVVVGAGMIGLLLVQVLRAAGCTQVIAVDVQEGRRALAQELGAALALDPASSDVAAEVRALTGGRGADAAFEAVGMQPTVSLGIDVLRKGGALVLVGNLAARVEIPLQVVVTRQLSVLGSCASCGEYPACLDLVRTGAVKLDPLMSATAPLSEGAAWFTKARDPKNGLMKVVLRP
jgi:L-iditol 2-dehydrogenase